MALNDRFAPSANGAPQRFVSDADQLIEEFQQIEQAWKRAEEKLAETRVPVDVEVKVSSGEDHFGSSAAFLSYEKIKGSRRICFVTKDCDYTDDSTEVERRPVVECPVDTRVELFDHFEGLYRQATAVAKSYIPKLKAARLKFEATLALIDV